MFRFSLTTLAALLAGLLFSLQAAEPARARRGEITLPTYPWEAVKHPYFRGTDGRNIYPYPMLDFLSREKSDRTYETVVLENSYLRITFLPELGGKIHEVLDKTTGEPMFYVNHVIKPGLIGMAGAWISGGVEWNTGPQGHTVGCVQPVPVMILAPEEDGSQSVAIGETERIYGTKWTVVVTLRPERAFIEERIRIYNPTETIRPYYFWNCTAVPNTPGFRFIYPMTLGTDHGARQFFDWPVHEGKDLSRGINYQDASSIFAWHCDQDFFGSYNDDLKRGVVAYANHHQLPGKKAWTWGWGGYGTMHQKDLTDEDGPYNEVQTGPLLTQGEVGRLDPGEAVEWQEWWYPVHDLGGFIFANKHVAVNADREGADLTLRLLGTTSWAGVELSVRAPGSNEPATEGRCDLSPLAPALLKLSLPRGLAKRQSLAIRLRHHGKSIAEFKLPLDLPEREPPENPASNGRTAAQLAKAGWEAFLLARYEEAEDRFHQALQADENSVPAHVGQAFLKLDSEPHAAMKHAEMAIAVNPGSGLGHYAMAVAADRRQDPVRALDEAWKAALDPRTATPARALVAAMQIRSGAYRKAVDALSASGPWQTDPLCRNRLAFACLKLGHQAEAVRLARQNLETDPLDTFAQSILWLAGAEDRKPTLAERLATNLPAFMELAASYADLMEEDWSLLARFFAEFVEKANVRNDPIAVYWAAFVRDQSNGPSGHSRADLVFPHRRQTEQVLRRALKGKPDDGHAALYLGHLLFDLGRHEEGRRLWKKAAALGAEPVIAFRALGMAAKSLDNDLDTARTWLERAHTAQPTDAIVARDLANTLFALSPKAEPPETQHDLILHARDILLDAFEEGKSRSDFVALLARAHNQLGNHSETAQLLDSVRITIWEGARETHNLFEEAHLVLGDRHLAAGRPGKALAEFNRALEYPDNLATGRLESTAEAHIHYRRGNALKALGRMQEALHAWRSAAEEPPSENPAKEKARRQAAEALEEFSREAKAASQAR